MNSTGRVVNDYELYRCPKCGSIGVLEEPAPEEVEKIYNHLFGVGEYSITLQHLP